VRLQIAGVPKEKITHERNELEAINKLNLNNIDKVFILHDLYSMELKEAVKEKVKIIIQNKEKVG